MPSIATQPARGRRPRPSFYLTRHWHGAHWGPSRGGVFGAGPYRTQAEGDAAAARMQAAATDGDTFTCDRVVD